MDFLAKALMAGISVTSPSVTPSPIIFAGDVLPCVALTTVEQDICDQQPKSVATVFKQTEQDLTQASAIFWDLFLLGDNYYKLQYFRSLQKGWDGYDGEEISLSAIARVTDLLKTLGFQPSIFPTGRGSIQIEYYQNDNTFAEIEVLEDRIGVYSEGVKGTVENEDISFKEASDILRAVYGR